MTTLFPDSSVSSGAGSSASALPTAVEAAWDFETDRPVFHRGEPVLVTGLEAVKVWAWNALKTARFRFRHHTRAYGCEIERLVGQPFSEDVKRSEAARYFREALEIDPYITGVEDVTAEFSGSTLTVRGTIRTIYGDTEVVSDV